MKCKLSIQEIVKLFMKISVKSLEFYNILQYFNKIILHTFKSIKNVIYHNIRIRSEIF